MKLRFTIGLCALIVSLCFGAPAAYALEAPATATPISAPIEKEISSTATAKSEAADFDDDFSDEDMPVFEITVSDVRKESAEPAARYDVEIGNLASVPRKSSAEHLMLAPGVLTANHGGEGHAHETYMRGFAAKEGQDIEFTVDGVPLNEVSNPHGHGYADLYFIPPEFVERVVITQGPFDPSQGDFAFAGSADYRLGVVERGAQAKYGIGLWNTHRLLLLYAPPEQDKETFAGFEFFKSGGYGENRASQRALGLARYAGELGKNLFTKFRISGFGYAARYDHSGVIRRDDYENGEIGFFDTYDPNQGGESSRFLLTLDTETGGADSIFKQIAFISYRSMRMRANFTGFLSDSEPEGETGIAQQRGDNIEMRYNALTAGSRGEYRLNREFWNFKQNFTAGYAFRFDRGDSSQFRLRAVTAIPYKRIFENDFTILNIAGWSRFALRPISWFAFRGGARFDAFSFGVTDHNMPAADREGSRIENQTSHAFGYAANPRATVEFTPAKGFDLVIGYGQGTRSGEAAALSDNESAPFALAHQVEGGMVYAYGTPGDAVSLKTQAGYVFTKVNKDMLFDELAGRNIAVGSSTRHALLLASRLNLRSWFDALLNAGWTKATLDETGELMPYIPRLVLRLDAAVKGGLFGWSIAGVPVKGDWGLGFTFVPGRPLPLKEKGDALYLLNSGGSIRLWYFSLGVEMRNLLNLRYRQAEFNYASNFEGPKATAKRVAERHFVAGEPFFVMGTLVWHIEEMFVRFSESSTSYEVQTEEPQIHNTEGNYNEE